MNEYREKFEELQDKDSFKGQQWFGDRQKFVEEYSWGVPSEDVIQYCAEFDNLIEVGAGSGYWAKCINDADGNVQATDIDPPKDTYTNVQQVAAYKLQNKIRDSPVLMVWPPYGESMAEIVARAEPSHILYVGEQRGGCTANDGFFYIIEEKYGLVGRLEIPSYAGINDDFYHYTRKV